MEQVPCNVIYIDRRANDEVVRRETLSNSMVARTSTSFSQGYFNLGKPAPVEVHSNVEAILSIFNEVYICGSGTSCIKKISQLLDSAQSSIPTLVLIDIPYDEEQRHKRLSREPRTPSPTSSRTIRAETREPRDIYGTHLLVHLSSEIQSNNFPKLVVPIVILSGLDRGFHASSTPGAHGPQPSTDPVRHVRYLDAGAVDVLSSPLSKERVDSLAIHVYRTHKEVARDPAAFLTTKRNRKLSWVGMNETKPYAYLREAMVSGLMGGICNPETVGDSLDSHDIYVEEGRQEAIAAAVGSWSFSAHEFTDDELLYGAIVMLKHALEVPELEKWRIDDDELTIFLLASRTAYNDFVLYHNFRHVIDVLQALFYFLVQIGTLPPYRNTGFQGASVGKPPIARLLEPFDALTLLVSAIGHDVGHPGVNNAFLVALNAPLAQLYNDRSVLESFHCAAYSQILRRYWPVAFADSAMRKLMINNILATDMGLHFTYMADAGKLQAKLGQDKSAIDSWSAKARGDHKDLVCGLLIKCADISNVAREFNTAAQWARVLSDEFINQGAMEQELQIPSCLFGGPPVRDDVMKLGESQIGFINIFAKPLFEAVTDILPAMRFSVDEILANRGIWEGIIAEEKERRLKQTVNSGGLLTPAASADPSLSTGAAPKQGVRTPYSPARVPVHEPSIRRSSAGSLGAAIAASRRSSSGVDHSRRSSATGLPGARSSSTAENQTQSRRGSADASLTAILVTHAPDPEKSTRASSRLPVPVLCSTPPEKRKDTVRRRSPTRSSGDEEMDGVRPVTAPSSARRSQGIDTPLAHSQSQSQLEVSLSHASNGGLPRSRTDQWSSRKVSVDANTSAPEVARDTTRRNDWWRQMSGRRRTRTVSRGDSGQPQPKEIVLESAVSNPTSSATSPTSPTAKSRTGKIKNFFKRKPRHNSEQEKQLSSYGSSSQLRTPPTSDPGQSVHSEG
ncbi:HD-domain/PDEase-like protein [Delitschia confertaspora ATCC 74209]|uniref:Phosphodiesterase n=1 Tax=Delitschia confertaspora ATCC 74209 TaxID=1513339 RepID=A0A9P4JWV9_9PLEO|nr:HD-domain/PDEase-like protein [Delitschia confertaspora ATCC 74209]